MNLFLSSFWSPANTESNVAVRSIIFLRLVMLGVATLFLVIWSYTYKPYQHWGFTGITFLAAAAWSLLVLGKDSLQTSSSAELRELLVDIAWVFVIVFFSGRATNPFVYYYMVLMAIAATVLSSRRAWYLCGLCVSLYSVMLIMDVKNHFTHFSSEYKIHLIGMWLNYVGSSVIICFFVSKLIRVLRDQQAQMTVIRENNLKNEQLIGLATVSASTVHNLATPLSTLTLLIDDVADRTELNDDMSKDLEIMREQISRCRTTMHELSTLAKKSDKKSVISVAELVEDLNEHYTLHFPEHKPDIICEFDEPFFIECSPLFEYAIINLTNNAMESSGHTAALNLSVTDSYLNIAISNEYDQAVDELSARWGQLTSSDKDTGLGIGSLLANSTIERQGGEAKLEILAPSGINTKSQVVVTVRFPLSTVS